MFHGEKEIICDLTYMQNLKKKMNTNRVQIDGCWGRVGKGDVEMGEGGQRIQTFNYKRNKFW